LQAGHHADRAPRAGADPDRRRRDLLAVPDQGLAAAEGAAGAGADPASPRPALRSRGRSPRPAAPPRALFRRRVAAVSTPTSSTHLVVIPSYDTGPLVSDTA